MAERVTGIGGFFFRAHDPAALADWYLQNLGIDPVPQEYGERSWSQSAGETIFTAIPEAIDQFGKPDAVWAINFRVDDLDAMVAQLRSAEVVVMLNPESYPNGRFASLEDPEGNPIQLWEPS